MKFSIVFSVGLVAVASAAQNDPKSTTLKSSYTPEQQACIKKCDPGDVDCLAPCFGNPAPNAAMVNATTKCSANCDPGKGSAADTKAYGDCQRKCAEDNFLPGGPGSITYANAKVDTKTPTDDTAPTPSSEASPDSSSAPESNSSTDKSSSSSTKSGTKSNDDSSDKSPTSTETASATDAQASSTETAPSSSADKVVVSAGSFVALLAAFIVL